jgi:hypothetical protein
MSFKQLLYPNLDNDPNHPLYIYQGGGILMDWYGWCLAVVAGSYGAKGSSYSAKTAWQANGTKHWDRNIPEGIWTPLWYEGGAYGHVVIGLREGNQLTIYSSPYTHKPTFDVFKGELNWCLDYVGRVYGVGGFSGWSETVLDSAVMCWEEPPVENLPPEPVNNPQPVDNSPEPVPEPEPEPSDDNDNKEGDDMSVPEPVQEQDQQQVASIIEEASQWIEIPNWLKVVAYIVGDVFIYGGVATPYVINMMTAQDATAFGTYLSSFLMATGIFILSVFKLIKKGSK